MNGHIFTLSSGKSYSIRKSSTINKVSGMLNVIISEVITQILSLVDTAETTLFYRASLSSRNTTSSDTQG